MSTFQVTQSDLRIPFLGEGHISCEVWGDLKSPDTIKILAVHGWQDNAGTFQRLFSLFPPSEYCIVAIDLPGHGQSTHLPDGACYSEYVWICALKTVIDSFGWSSNVNFIAHSMGSNAVLLLASLFPHLVGSFVMLDNVMPRICAPEQLHTLLAADIERFASILELKQNNTNSNRSYDYEMAIQIIVMSHSNGAIDRYGAECLLKRAIKHVGSNKVLFRRDPRLNQPIYQRKTKCQLFDQLSTIQADRLLILRARNTALRTDDDPDFVELYKTCFRVMEYRDVGGDHYAHLTRPRECLPHILDFLSQIRDN